MNTLASTNRMSRIKPLPGVLAMIFSTSVCLAMPTTASSPSRVPRGVFALGQQAQAEDTSLPSNNRIRRVLAAPASTGPGTNSQIDYHVQMQEAESDMAQIEASTPLLIADFQVIDEQEKSLEKVARKLCSQYRPDPSSSRVDRYGAHVLAFNKLWSECTQADALYSTYLDRCADHFRLYHRPDLEMQMRQAPCGRSILSVMGEQYAKLHQAVLQAHAERLKLLAVENSLRSEVGTEAFDAAQSVHGNILVPPGIPSK